MMHSLIHWLDICVNFSGCCHVGSCGVCDVCAGLNLFGGQEDGREEQDATSLCQTGPSVHRSPPNRRDHLPRDIQRFPSDGPVHPEGRRSVRRVQHTHCTHFIWSTCTHPCKYPVGPVAAVQCVKLCGFKGFSWCPHRTIRLRNKCHLAGVGFFFFFLGNWGFSSQQ